MSEYEYLNNQPFRVGEANEEESPEFSGILFAANKLAGFLNILLAVDYDIDVIDRLAKSRRVDEFWEAVYNALRRRENLEDKIARLREDIEENERENIERALGILRSLEPGDIERLFRELNEKQVRKWASYIGSRALVFNRTFGTIRKNLERGGG